MDMTPESKFLKVGINIKDGDMITFKNEGKLEPGKWGDKIQIEVQTPNLENKLLSLNNASRSNMIELYGRDSKNWVGKEARVNIVKQMVANEMKNIIVLTAVNTDAEGSVLIQ
jgi:hypothetical protein